MTLLDIRDLATVTGGANGSGPAIKVIVPLTGPVIKKPSPGDDKIYNNTDKPITYK